MKRLHLFAALGLLIYIIFVWFLAGWLHLGASSLWILRVALWLIGIAATALVVYFLTKGETEAAAPVAGEADLRGDVEFLVREANRGLAASQNIRKGGRHVSGLPLVLFLGDTGAAKTTVILNSGLEPELMAGQVFKDSAVIPTQVANLWLGGEAILVEAGGPLAASSAGFRRALELLRGRTLANLVGRRGQSPRAVVICYDSANFTISDSRSAVDQASRRLRAILGEIAHRWGSRLPIYVLFTKLDQVPFFLDYFNNLTQEESSQLFGVTLRMAPGDAAGVYSEQQTRRLTEAFESLFGSLSDRRLDYLRRENDSAKVLSGYEFPANSGKCETTWCGSSWRWAGQASCERALFCAASISPGFGPWWLQMASQLPSPQFPSPMQPRLVQRVCLGRPCEVPVRGFRRGRSPLKAAASPNGCF